jgi:hypothetical protein
MASIPPREHRQSNPRRYNKDRLTWAVFFTYWGCKIRKAVDLVTVTVPFRRVACL